MCFTAELYLDLIKHLFKHWQLSTPFKQQFETLLKVLNEKHRMVTKGQSFETLSEILKLKFSKI